MNAMLRPFTRIMSLVCALALAAVIFLPLWRIDLTAPQYPEGLSLVIRPDGLHGDVEVVNGLNHYIGMRTLHTADFVEFQVLPYIIGAFAIFGLLTFIIRRKWFYSIWAILYIAFGILAMVDFYRWEYNYGHNLDTTAPIQVPGMAYQPPLIGFKQLLNFGAYSIPDIGGWIFLGVGALLLAGLWMEWRSFLRKPARGAVLMVIIMLSTQGCQQKPEPFQLGSDACYFCKMSISQANFGGEWISSKGKLYKFDDIKCLTSYLKAAGKEEKGEAWLASYLQPQTFYPADQAWILASENLQTPMGGHMAAFGNEADLQLHQQKLGGKAIRWADIQP